MSVTVINRWVVLILAAVWVLLAAAAPAQAIEGETFAITEIDFDARTMEITNHGESEVDPNGVIVCNFPTYVPIQGAPTLAPGESFTVDLQALGVPADAADGEMGLYLDDNFASSDSIVSYVEWGASGHERSPVAQGAEVAGQTVWDGAALDGGGAAIQATTPFPTSGAEWTVIAAGQDEAAVLPFTGVPTAPVVAGAIILVGVGGALVSVRRRTT